MTEPETPPKPLSSADKGWTGKVDSAIEDFVRTAWLLLSFPAAVSLRFLQPRRSATVALAEARRAGRLMPPLFGLALAVLLIPHLLDAFFAANQHAMHASTVLAHELETRASRLGSELLTRTAPLLALAWIGTHLLSRPLSRLTGHSLDDTINAARYLIAITACIAPMASLMLLTQIAHSGQKGQLINGSMPWLFTVLVALAALAPLGGIVHAAADAWRHAATRPVWRRVLRSLGGTLCAAVLVLLLPLSGMDVDAGKTMSPYRLVAEWFFDPDPRHADDDRNIEVSTRHCTLDGQTLHCALLLKGLGAGDLHLTDLRDPVLEVVHIPQRKPDGKGVIKTALLDSFDVAAVTLPSLTQGRWMSIKAGALTPFTLHLNKPSLCEAVNEARTLLNGAADIKPGQSTLRVTATVFLHPGGPPSSASDTRVVLLPNLAAAMNEAGAGCPAPP